MTAQPIPFQLPEWADRYEFDERAGLYEFYAKISRPEAELRAFRDMLRERLRGTDYQTSAFSEEKTFSQISE
jgi:hypothetical protein